MIPFPSCLQGTDGIRGRIDTQGHYPGLSPLEVWLTHKLLTPAFAELYCYAYGQLLLERLAAEPQDQVVLGWDPRDPKGHFISAATQGLQKAGLGVLLAGELPTPAFPLLMLQKNAVGAVVLTASHNPDDQNGIKLFHGFTGLKFLPGDDQALTAKIIQLHQADLASLPLVGQTQDVSAEAKELFVETNLQGVNSWLMGWQDPNLTLVIDASKGAVARVAREIFSQVACQEVIYCNLEGPINQNCGVADIEGKEVIPLAEIKAPHSPWSQYQCLTTLAQRAENLPQGQRLAAFVFDGDGDRCYRLDLDPEAQELLVSSGDALGLHLARYKRHGHPKLVCHTVESDLQVAIQAEQEGFQPLITGVGDKWILLRAVLDQMMAFAHPDRLDGLELLDQCKALLAEEQPAGLGISLAWRDYVSAMPLTGYKLRSFLVGFEESGHSITPAQQTDSQLSFFAGNGIKTALNSLAACQGLSLEELRHPHPVGLKSTLYVYYVDKARLNPGHPFRQQLGEYLLSSCQAVLDQGEEAHLVPFPEEASMNYLEIKRQGKLLGAIFVRNSGTEDKSALYLRGDQELESRLAPLAEALHLFLLVGLKDFASAFAQAELAMLRLVAAGQDPLQAAQAFPNLPLERMLKEIERKEHLLTRNEGGLCLSMRGQQFLASNQLPSGS